MNVKDILDQVGQDVLTDETKKLLAEAFEDAVNTKVNETTQLEVQTAMQKLDENHAEKLQKLLEAIDIDHTDKLKAVIDKIDVDHAEKLNYLIERHKTDIGEDAAKFKSELVTQLSNYIDIYLDKAVPRQEISEAVSNKQAQKILTEIKQLVAVDEEFINETIKEAVSDGKKTIDALQNELQEAIKTNIQLNQGFKSVKAALVLEKATASLPREKKEFTLRVLKGKDPEYITENLDYVVRMFDKEEEGKKEILTEEATQASKVVAGKVDVPAAERKPEITSQSAGPGEPGIDYLQTMEYQDRFRRQQ